MSSFGKSMRHIRRSPYQAIAATLIMVFTFVVGGVFFLLVYGSSLAISYFESKPQLIIFFSDNTEKTVIDGLASKLQNTGKVASTQYVSKDDALQLYRQWYQDDPLLLEMVTADILPQSLEVSAIEARDLEDLAQMVQNESGVEDIEYQADVVETLVAWTSIVRRVGIVFVSFLIVESLLVLVTVVGMKIALRREEIEILQLIGATKGYIGKPFIIEGALYGFIGSLTGWIVAIAGLFVATPAINALLGSVPISPFDPVFMSLFFVGMITTGMLLGAFGSFLALLRYVR